MPPSDKNTRQILKKVRQVEIHTNRMVTDSLSGAYHSIFKGQGMDFEEVREYAPGDDIRAIDWNVTAKMHRPFIKKFREERELTIILLLDLSSSGCFGSVDESKRELAAEIASVLAFSAIRNNDKVGLILFTDRIEKFIAPKKGRQHVLRVIREMLFFEPQGKSTNISVALDYLTRVVTKKAVVFLISDFLQGADGQLINPEPNPKNSLIKHLSLTSKRHDLIGVILSDQRERELPNIGIITLEDAETGEQVEIDTSNATFREKYKKLTEERLENFSKTFKKIGGNCMTIKTEIPYINELRRFFEKRKK